MDEAFLYQQIAESIRKDILEGRLKPGDRLPSVRQMCTQWKCTPGTVQRAYNELVQQRLLVSQSGRGTCVAGTISTVQAGIGETLRRANLVHRSEAYLLEVLTAGYNLNEIQQALDLAMDRWRVLKAQQDATPRQILRFAGSNDMVLNGLAHDFFGRIFPDAALQLTYNGSLDGLIALSQGKVDVTGCHLWDEETGEYNIPYIRRYLPGKNPVVITLAHRRLGLIFKSGNPHKIKDLSDLKRPGLRFVNRQSGSGTRIWLDKQLNQLGIDTQAIQGFDDERFTHSDVARFIADDGADLGLGLETAALAYGLDFCFLTRERYDLVMLPEIAALPPFKALIRWLRSEEGKQYVAKFRGYDNKATGEAVKGITEG